MEFNQALDYYENCAEELGFVFAVDVHSAIEQIIQMTGGVNFSYGAKDTEFGDFTLPGTDIRSKAPDSAYLWLT